MTTNCYQADANVKVGNFCAGIDTLVDQEADLAGGFPYNQWDIYGDGLCIQSKK